MTGGWISDRVGGLQKNRIRWKTLVGKGGRKLATLFQAWCCGPVCLCVSLCFVIVYRKPTSRIFSYSVWHAHTRGELLLLVLYAIALSMSKMKLFHVCIFSHPFPIPVVVLIKLNATRNLPVSLIEVHMQREWENLCKTSRIGPHPTYPLLNDNYEMDNPSQ